MIDRKLTFAEQRERNKDKNLYFKSLQLLANHDKSPFCNEFWISKPLLNLNIEIYKSCYTFHLPFQIIPFQI